MAPRWMCIICWWLFHLLCLTIWRTINKMKQKKMYFKAALRVIMLENILWRYNFTQGWQSGNWTITQNYSMKRYRLTFYFSRQTTFTWWSDLNTTVENRVTCKPKILHITNVQMGMENNQNDLSQRCRPSSTEFKAAAPNVSVVKQLGHSNTSTVLVFFHECGRVAFVRYWSCTRG